MGALGCLMHGGKGSDMISAVAGDETGSFSPPKEDPCLQTAVNTERGYFVFVAKPEVTF